MHRLLVFCFILSCSSSQEIMPLKILRKSIFKIQVISKEPRFSQPWLLRPSLKSFGSGFYIGNKRIMTNAHVVAHGKYIGVQRDGDAQPTPARVEFIAHDSDLAILRVDSEGAFEGSKPLKLGKLPSLRDKVATIGYPRGGEQISVTEGVVSRISYRRYAHPGYDRHLLVQVDSAINPGNSGGPVFKGDQVVGVAFQAHTNAENTGYIIPTPVVERFLKDIDNGYYDGHPEDGLSIVEGATENKGTLEYHGLKDRIGVKVGFVTPYSSMYQQIEPGDIITKINGNVIGEDGKIKFFGERINFKAVYDLAQIGDVVSFEVLRKEERKSIDVTVHRNRNHYSPSNIYTMRPRYIVYGGMIFSSLSRDYLKAWGDQWYYDAPLNLRFFHRYYYSVPRFSKSRDIIILSGILPNRANIDADQFTEHVLDTFNGETVYSLDELKDFFEKKSEDDWVKLKFIYQNQPLVLSKKELSEAHSKILDQYKVSPDHWLGTSDDDGALGVDNR